MAEATLRLSAEHDDHEASAPVMLVAPAAHPAPAMALEIVRDMAALGDLEAGWSVLFTTHGSPEQVFQSYGWCWHWCRHYLSADEQAACRLAIVIGRLDDRIVLVLPLVVERRAGVTSLSFLGDPICQYGDLLAAPEVRDEASLARAWQFAVTSTKADVANLRKVRRDSLAARLLAHLGSRVVAQDEAPFVDLTKAIQEPGKPPQLANRRRAKNRRRQLRRLEEVGSVHFETLPPGPLASDMAELAIRHKREWLARKNEISRAFADERFLHFFRDAVSGTGPAIDCRVCVLRSNDVVAAIQIMPVCGDHAFLHISVYDPDFERFGAGSLLLEWALHDSITEGARRFDLLPPRYEYKMEFADGVAEVQDHALSMTLAGRLHAAVALGLRRRVKTALAAMPAPVRGFAAAMHRRLSGRTAGPQFED